MILKNCVAKTSRMSPQLRSYCFYYTDAIRLHPMVFEINTFNQEQHLLRNIALTPLKYINLSNILFNSLTSNSNIHKGKNLRNPLMKDKNSSHSNIRNFPCDFLWLQQHKRATKNTQPDSIHFFFANKPTKTENISFLLHFSSDFFFVCVSLLFGSFAQNCFFASFLPPIVHDDFFYHSHGAYIKQFIE